MSIGSDSRVVDALQEGHNLERVLRALGCDTSKDNGSSFESGGGFIHCPMPDHPDANESASVLAKIGCIECRSLCGTIRPLDLIVAHGAAPDRAEAAKWVEALLGLEKVPLKPPMPLCDDPSLTVAQYLAMRGLPDWIADKFGLEDVRIHQFGLQITQNPDGTTHVKEQAKNVAFETGWFNAVFMPMRPGRHPRVRSAVPKAKLKWAPKVRFRDGRMADYLDGDRDEFGLSRKYPKDAIGVEHVEPTPAGMPNVLAVVEGESDVHAMHAMRLGFVVGVPGTKFAGRVATELLESCLAANGGDTDLSGLTVVVWQEPGLAGTEFPRRVSTAINDAALERGWRSPQFATLHHGAVQGSPKDPAAMLSDLPPELAAQRMHDAIMAVLPSATVAAQVAEPPVRAAAGNAGGGAVVAAGVQAPLEILQVDGEHTAPPDTVLPGIQATTTSNVGDSGHSVSAAGDIPPPPPPPAGGVSPWGIPLEQLVYSAAPRGEAALWESFEDLEDAPEHELAPAMIEGFNCTFHRAVDGWTVEKVDKEGDSTYVSICSAFVVEQVERCSGEILVRVAAPFGGAWNRTRFELSNTADAGRTCGQLASIGVLIANRQRPAVTDLLLALAREREATAGAVHVPAGTGWSGRPGTSAFGGIDVEPVNDFGSRMFEANKRRRERKKDTLAAARAWWKLGACPLLNIGADGKLRSYPAPTPSGAAALMAIGAAAAAPLVGPLSEVGVSVSPVVWIAGLGGGGKSITQTLAASIFAPKLPDLDGQIAYFANANISQAALSARVDSCRDLPLILDDVTQLPPAPGSTSRGDAARIEAAAALGMLVFNRKPIERATRDGGIRQTRAFRSTAIFSAEVNMSSESSKAVVTAGQRRRIATIEARPMAERGLGQAYAETVNDLAAEVGGAPGDLLVTRIREVVSGRELRGLFDDVRARLSKMPEAADVTLTQREALAIDILGFALLAQALGEDYEGAVQIGLATIGPYMAAGAGAGGATKDSDLTGVDAALRSVEEMFAAHRHRFDREIHEGFDLPVPLQGYLGKQIRSQHDGSRRIVLLRPGMEMLGARYGVTMQVIEQAQAEKRCKQRHQFRMSSGERVYGVCWILPPSNEGDDEEDFDPTAPGPHDADPHGLAEPITEGKKNVGLLTVVSSQGWKVPAHLQAYFDTLISREAAKFVFESGRDAMMMAYQTGEGVREINHQDGDINMDFRFAWGAGLYIVGDAQTMAHNQSLHVTIRRDVQEELVALRGHYVAAAEADPEGVLGVPIEVADFPADDDPRWLKIDELGWERAREQWRLHNEALWRANHSETREQSRIAHEQHVKHQRIHLMCRHRHPEWFIVDMQSLA